MATTQHPGLRLFREDVTIKRFDAGVRNLEVETEGTTTGSHAVLRLTTVATGGAPHAIFTRGTMAFWMGVDTADDLLKIGRGSGVGSLPVMTFDNMDMVGIGTSAPSTKLHIKDSGSTAIRIEAGTQAAFTLDSASSSDARFNMRQGGDSWIIRANGTSKDWELISVPAGGVAIGVQRANNRVTLAAGLGVFGVAPPAAQPAKINDPSGGATIDAEARTAINAIIDVLEGAGLSST